MVSYWPNQTKLAACIIACLQIEVSSFVSLVMVDLLIEDV